MSVQPQYPRKVVTKNCFQEKLSPVLEAKSDLINDAQYNILLTEFMTSDTLLLIYRGTTDLFCNSKNNKIHFP